MKLTFFSLCCFALLAAGCSQAISDSPEGSSNLGPQEELERQRIETMLPSASAVQQEVLADGYVTLGEADKTAAEVVNCSAEQGVLVEPLYVSGEINFQVHGGPIEEVAEEASNIFERCYEEQFFLVASMLAMQNSLSDDETKRINQLVLDCLAVKGVIVESWPDTEQEIDAATEAECFATARDEINFEKG